MSFIAKKILNLRARSGKVKRPAVKKLDYDNAKQIGLFYTWDNISKMDSIEQFKEQLINEGKEVSIFCFNPEKEEVNCLHPLIGLEHISGFGKIKSPELDSFLAESFDYLILLDFELSEVSSFVMANSKAYYRIGNHSEQALSYFELLMHMNESAGIDNLIEQIIKYIKVIKHE